MSLLTLIAMLLNPFAELEVENERLRWVLSERISVEINLRERLRKMNETNDIIGNKLEIRVFNNVSTYPIMEDEIPYEH